ncbi:DnaD domain protein [Mycoplasma enhydrae]|uniref:DnaD domain protein n=1 Tax=Mycoplasma enhydrae TaxID=2499220 RepID=UPI00197BFE41|nr:DnaD domain protein [Mycoplasma enhydrae]MBN4089446.1 DnaD domain protein [Mycoplasma enhydrae]MCV3733502.1 DnaD domain protein [Mycoplasma enhydrae]MCV3753250.1 DnaD domain protein [Mycoplasma enhydrae]
MNQIKFFVDSFEDITSKDLVNIRTFYSPIIGLDGISLYHHFYDLYNLNRTKKYDLTETSEFLVLDLNNLINARHKLEAIGLLKTFQDLEGNLLIKLNKPLNANEIAKNELVSELLISKLGENKYLNLIKNNAAYFHDASQMNDVSKKFFDMFDKNQVFFKNQNCLDFMINDESHMINNLNSAEYIHFLTKKELSPSQLLMLKRIRALKFDDVAINYFIRYSVNINNSIVCSYIEKIALDFAKKRIFDSSLIDSELSEAMQFKNKNNIITKTSQKRTWDFSDYSEDGLSWDD